MASDVRRIVTGLDADNKAVVLFDSRLPFASRPSGVASTNLWITDSYPPALSFTPDDPAKKPIGIAPPDNGTVFRLVEFPPLDAATEAKLEPDFLMKSLGDHAPTRGVKPTHPFMHRTRTLDYAVVLSGEIEMMLDDTSVHLKPGDTVVQQATNHAWINRGQEPCRVLFVLMDSKQP
jgi:mannose-6-phosphate isomerase-like protein (cupin superfamily)